MFAGTVRAVSVVTNLSPVILGLRSLLAKCEEVETRSQTVSAESIRLIMDAERRIARCLQRLEQEWGASQRCLRPASRKARPARITHRDLMLASASEKPFDSAGWIFELRYDGLRVLAIRDAVGAHLLSRTGTDLAPLFPEVVAALLTRPQLVADGQLVVLDEQGQPQLEAVRRRSLMRKPTSIREAARRSPADLLVFDILKMQDKDLRMLPLLERKKLLQGAFEGLQRVRPMQYIHERGKRLYDAARTLGVNGIVAKRANAPYVAGRSGDWQSLHLSPPPRSRFDSSRKRG